MLEFNLTVIEFVEGVGLSTFCFIFDSPEFKYTAFFLNVLRKKKPPKVKQVVGQLLLLQKNKHKHLLLSLKAFHILREKKNLR